MFKGNNKNIRTTSITSLSCYLFVSLFHKILGQRGKTIIWFFNLLSLSSWNLILSFITFCLEFDIVFYHPFHSQRLFLAECCVCKPDARTTEWNALLPTQKLICQFYRIFSIYFRSPFWYHLQENAGKIDAQQVRNWPKENTYFRQVEK